MIAADLMTPKPKTIRVTTTVTAALDILWSLDVRHLPVIDEDGELVGMLSDRDVAPLVKFDDGVAVTAGKSVGDVMSGDVISVDADTELEGVIETLLEERIGAVPVVDGEGSVVGIISYVDVLRTYAGELGASTGNSKAKKAAKPKKKASAPKKKASAPKKPAKKAKAAAKAKPKKKAKARR